MRGIQVLLHNVNWSDQKEDILNFTIRIIKIMSKFSSVFLMETYYLELISTQNNANTKVKEIKTKLKCSSISYKNLEERLVW